jgi:hypothetical protein
MQGIAEMKTYKTDDLAILLSECAMSLALAYQELSDGELNRLSFEAHRASDFLSFLVASQHPNHQIH